MKITWTEWILQLLFIALSAWLIASGFSIEAQDLEIINGVETLTIKRSLSLVYQLLLCIVTAVIVAYVNIYFLFNYYRRLPNYKLVLYSLTLLLVGFLLCFTIPSLTSNHALMLPTSLSLGIPIFYYTLSTAYGFGKIWWSSEQQRQQLVLDKKQAELNLLRNQLQPHFLFNALNNLLALVDQKQTPLLATSFDRLSQLLRYVIDESRVDSATIGKEIIFIQNYAALQLLRFEPGEVDFDLKITGTHNEQAIEPGLFIPFVENAFKHGTEPESPAKIAVTFDIEKPGEIIFTIKNKVIDIHQDSKRTSTGIRSTKERLELIYPRKHTLEIDTNEYFKVVLKITTT
jgi:hypothetical protein